MPTRYPLWSLGVAVLLSLCSFAFCEDWQNIYQSQANSADLETLWTSSGDWVQQQHNLTIKSQQEAMLRLNQSIEAAVIDVAFNYTYTEKTFSEAGILIGLGGGGRRAAAQFILQGGETTGIKLIVPARAPFIIDTIKFTANQSYRIHALVNGQSVELYIDSKKVAQRQLMSPLPAGKIALFASQANATFSNLIIRTKKVSDAQLAQRVRQQAREKAIKAQFDPGYLPPTWDPSKLKFKNRSARTRLKQIPLKIQSDLPTPGPYPIRIGVPITDRQMFRPQQFRLLGPDGQPIPCQITPTALWKQEGALKWIMVNANIQIDDPSQPMDLTLEYGRSVRDVQELEPMSIQETDAAITVDTGKLKITFSKKSGTLIDSASIAGKPVMMADPNRGGFFVDNNNETYRTSGKDDDYKLSIEVTGTMHTIIKATGWYVNQAGIKACQYVTRIHLYKDQALLHMEHTWIVTLDTDPFWFKDLGINLPMSIPHASQTVMGISDQKITESVTHSLDQQTIRLTQSDLNQFNIFKADTSLAKATSGGGWVSLLGDDTAATLTVRDMAMQFPNELEVSEKGITFHAWKTLEDKELNFRHEGIAKLWGKEIWQQLNDNVTSQGAFESRVSNGLGFARTHHLTLTFHEPTEKASQIAGALGQTQPIASIDPNWIKDSQVMPLMLPVYDQKRFGEHEKQIQENFDEYLKIASNIKPMVGFWDYGRGIPQDIKKTSNGRWMYSGINANADMNDGNAQVAWLLYLRSGERKYYQRAIAMTTHVMDTRIIHWYAKSLDREIGQSYKHTGAWVFDGSDAGWTGDIWPGFLATAYHLTGNQRSLDVLGEIANGFIHTKRPQRNHKTVTYLGAIGRYYSTCWDSKLLDTLAQTSPMYFQKQLETGFWPYNDQAYEYALLELLKLPKIQPSWENTAMNFARGAIGSMRFHTNWANAASIQSWAYHNKQTDARFGVNAKEAIQNGIPKLTGYANMAPLRNSLTWLGLSDIEGINEIVPPKVLSYARPHESVFYLKHISGKSTHIELHCKQGEMSITDIADKPIAPHLLRSQRSIGIYEIRLNKSLPDTQYKIQIKLPVMYESEDGSLGRSLPWRPNENELLVVMHGPTLFVQDISNGKLTHFPGKQTWFFVPVRTTAFEIQAADPWPLMNDLIVKRPDSGFIKTEGSTISVTPESSHMGKLWMLQSKQPYFQMTQTAFAHGPISPGYLKLTGIPPFVAPSKECYFRPAAASMQDDNTKTKSIPIAYPRGKFRRGVRLAGHLNYLQLPTGKVSKDRTKRAYFDANQGTIEMFIRLDRRITAGGYTGKLLHIPFAQSPLAMLDFIPSSSWEGTLRSGGAQARQVQLTDSNCSPSLTPGKWYHLAIQWNLNDNGKLMRRIFVDGYPFAYGDASGKFDPIDWWPQSAITGDPGPWIYLGNDGKNKFSTSAMVIDELRVSDIPRYPFMPGPPKVGGRKAFVPPTEPFSPDSHTCSIYHFEGSPNGIDKHGKTIEGILNITKSKKRN